jgi:hypothetical protein
MRQKFHGWSTRRELQCGEIVVVTVAAETLTEACEKLRILGDDIDPLHVRETTMIERSDEPREMESYQTVAVDWREET